MIKIIQKFDRKSLLKMKKKKLKINKKTILILLVLLIYLSLGQLRFFANNYPKLGFIHKNYLILLQNNYEIRPNGGFITAYGELSLFMGIPYKFQINDSYQIDHSKNSNIPYPQEELLASSKYQGYTFRDANAYVDFRDSQKDILNFYHEKYPKKDIDGIIGVNSSILESALENLGAIEIKNKIYSKESFFSLMEYEVNKIDKHNPAELNQRKAILKATVKKLIFKSFIHPFKFKNTIIESLENKDLFIWFKNEDLENKIIAKNWGNTIKIENNENFFGINLSNYGANKSDRYLKQEVEYFLDLKSNKPIITANVKLIHPGVENTFSAPYQGYLQIIIPKESQLLNSPANSRSTFFADYQTAGSIIKVDANTSQTFQFKYSLPNTYNQPDQILKFFKQSGSTPLYKIYIENNPEHSFINAEKTELKINENQIFFTQTLEKDLEIKVTQTVDKQAPFAIDQEFISPNEIIIYFSEDLNPSGILNPNNYSIKDLNIEDSNIQDKKVMAVRLHSPKDIILSLNDGQTQTNEHFKITINQLSDLSGNKIEPLPKNLTAVNRSEKYW